MKKYLLSTTRKAKELKNIYFIILFFINCSFVFGQSITPTKTVTVNPSSCGIIDVELKIQGANPISRPLEVVLVIDLSGSMANIIAGDTHTSMDYAITAASDFVNNVLTLNNPTGLNKVAIVKYSTKAKLVQGLTLASGQADLITVINNLNANGGTTNIQDAIVKADQELTAHGTFDCNTARSIVFFTDGVANRTGANADYCTAAPGGTCVQSAITAANNAKTTTVSSVVYNNQIFAVGLFGGISGALQATAEYTLNNIQSSGAYFTESGADLSGIYSQIFTQLSWVVTQLTGIPFVTETISNNFNLDTSSITISKGSYSVSGQVISWNVPFLNIETITLKYKLTPKANICGSQIVSSTKLDYLNSYCTAVSTNIVTPSYCVPCPPIVTKGNIASCYSTVQEAEAAAIAATTATNNCTQTLTKTASTSGTCNAIITVTVTNSCGNSSSVTYNTKIDNVAPVLAAAPSNITVECIGDLPPMISLAYTDNCDASGSQIGVDATQVGDNCGGTITRTWNVSDTCGNPAITRTQIITIKDKTAPVIAALPAVSTINCPAVPAFATATATDNCGSSFTLTFADVTTNGSCAGSYSVTRTWTATVACGNSSQASQTINVQDISAPVFTSNLPNDISVSCDAIPSPGVVTASDDCDTDVNISVSDEIVRDEGSCAGNYTIIRTWTITDDCQNSNSYSQTITVFDIAPPTLVTPFDEELNASCSNVPEVPNLEFEDNCSGVANVIYSEVITTISNYQHIIVRDWFVSDNCGNSDNFTQTINISVEDPFNIIPFRICTQEEPIDLFTILDDSVPTNGIWVDLSDTGGLNGSKFSPLNIPVGSYTLRYIVTIENEDCPMLFDIYLNINNDCIVLAACDIVVYNAVSPNNDGLNEFLFIDGIDCYPNNTVEIYNRWGILVYDTQGYNKTTNVFRGQSEGRSTLNRNELLPDGTYYYILKYIDEESKTHDKSGYLYVNK